MASEVYTISQGKSLAKGYRDRWMKRLEERQEEMEKAALIQSSKVQEDENKDDRGFAKKVFDQVNIVDSGRDFKRKDPSEEGRKKNSAEQLGDTGRALFGNTAKLANTVAEGTRSTIELERAIAARLTGNKEAEQAALRRGTSKENSLLEEGRGLLGVGGTIDEETAKDMDTKDLLKASARGGAGTASEILPGARGFAGATKGARLLRAGAEGAALGGVGSGVEEALDEDEEFDLKQVGQDILLGGAIGAGGHALGTLGGKTQENRKPPTGDIENGPASPAGLIGDGTPDPKLLPERAGEPVRPLAEIDEELETLQTNRDPNMSNDEAKTRFAELQRERQIAEINEAETGFRMERDIERTNFETNGLPNDPVEARRALDEFDSNPPETVYKTATPVTSIDEVVQRPDMPVEIKQAATELAQARTQVTMQLNSLMSPLRKQEEVMRLDEQYAMEQADLDVVPEPRRSRELALLDEDYNNALDDLDQQEIADADQVGELTKQLNDITTGEQNIVLDTNQLMKEAPDNFRDIDEVELEAQRTALEDNVAKAERFNSPANVVAELADSPDPVKTYTESPEVQTAVQSQADVDTKHIPDFKNITGVRQSLLLALSPSNILEKMGRSDIFTGLVRAESSLNLANKTDAEVIRNISARLNGNKELQKQVIDYLEGGRKTLSAADAETADMIRVFLDEKKAGLKEMGYATLDDYFPHMFDKGNKDALRLFKPKSQTAEVKFGNLKERLTDSEDFSKDITEVLSMYASGYNKKAFLEPALKPLQDIKLQQEISQAEVDWVNKYIEQLKGTNASGFEQAVDNAVGKGKYRQILGTQRMVSAVATMGLNPGTAIRNLTQAVNTVADIGPRYSTIGMMRGIRALRAGPNSPEWNELQQMGILEGGVSHNYYDDIDAGVNVRSNASKTASDLASKAMFMVRGTDIALRTQAYYGAKALGEAKGLTGEALKDFALKKVVNSQFMTSKLDMPVGLNGPMVRSFTQLATFSAKQAGFIQRQVGGVLKKGPDGKYRLDEKQAGNLLAAGITMMAATELLKPTIGFREEEWIPFYQQVAPYWPGNEEEGQGGDQFASSLYRSPLVTLLAGDGKSKIGLLSALQQNKLDEFGKDQWSSVVPIGTQAKKSYEGFTTTESGISKNAEGNIRYLQDVSADDKIKASLFGQYATKAGQSWIKDKFPTLTSSEMRMGQSEEEAAKSGVTMETANRETQETYYDYYSATKKAGGRQKAYDAVKTAAINGNQKEAKRLANDYNKALNKALGSYWKKHDELPDALRQDLERSYIDVNKVNDNLED